LALWLGAEGALSLLLCVLAHEAGHLTAIRLAGGKVRYVRIRLLGAVIVCDPMPYLREAAAVLAGPTASLLLAALSGLLAETAGGRLFYLMAGMSLALGLFNLCPLIPWTGEGPCCAYGIRFWMRRLCPRLGHCLPDHCRCHDRRRCCAYPLSAGWVLAALGLQTAIIVVIGRLV
jgi:Zn-dependent protease